MEKEPRRHGQSRRCSVCRLPVKGHPGPCGQGKCQYERGKGASDSDAYFSRLKDTVRHLRKESKVDEIARRVWSESTSDESEDVLMPRPRSLPVKTADLSPGRVDGNQARHARAYSEPPEVPRLKSAFTSGQESPATSKKDSDSEQYTVRDLRASKKLVREVDQVLEGARLLRNEETTAPAPHRHVAVTVAVKKIGRTEHARLVRGVLGNVDGTGSGASAEKSGTESGATAETSGTESGATAEKSGTESGATAETSGTESGATAEKRGTESGATAETSGIASGATTEEGRQLLHRVNGEKGVARIGPEETRHRKRSNSRDKRHSKRSDNRGRPTAASLRKRGERSRKNRSSLDSSSSQSRSRDRRPKKVPRVVGDKLSHLSDLMFDAVYHDWVTVRELHAAVLYGLEHETVTWSDSDMIDTIRDRHYRTQGGVATGSAQGAEPRTALAWCTVTPRSHIPETAAPTTKHPFVPLRQELVEEPPSLPPYRAARAAHPDKKAIELHRVVSACEGHNFVGARVPVESALKIDSWRELLVDYEDRHDFGGAEYPQVAMEAFNSLQGTLHSLGLEESVEKAVEPTTCMTFLGIEFDTVAMVKRVPQFRLEEVRLLIEAWIDKKKALKRELQSLIGKLRRFMTLFNGVSLLTPDIYCAPDEVVATDACLTGCGGICNGEFFHSRFPTAVLEQYGAKIHVLEMLTIVVAARKWGPGWRGSRIVINSETDLSYLREQAPKRPSQYVVMLISCLLSRTLLMLLQLKVTSLLLVQTPPARARGDTGWLPALAVGSHDVLPRAAARTQTYRRIPPTGRRGSGSEFLLRPYPCPITWHLLLYDPRNINIHELALFGMTPFLTWAAKGRHPPRRRLRRRPVTSPLTRWGGRAGQSHRVNTFPVLGGIRAQSPAHASAPPTPAAACIAKVLFPRRRHISEFNASRKCNRTDHQSRPEFHEIGAGWLGNDPVGMMERRASSKRYKNVYKHNARTDRFLHQRSLCDPPTHRLWETQITLMIDKVLQANYRTPLSNNVKMLIDVSSDFKTTQLAAGVSVRGCGTPVATTLCGPTAFGSRRSAPGTSHRPERRARSPLAGGAAPRNLPGSSAGMVTRLDRGSPPRQPAWSAAIPRQIRLGITGKEAPLAWEDGLPPHDVKFHRDQFEPPDAMFRRGFPAFCNTPILSVKALLSSNPGLNLRHAARDTLLFYTGHQCRHICPVCAKLPAPANDAGFRTVETISVHGEGFSLVFEGRQLRTQEELKGHIKSIEVAKKDGTVFVKAKVLASMKQKRYKTMLAFGDGDGDGKELVDLENALMQVVYCLLSRTSLGEVEPQPLRRIHIHKTRYGKVPRTATSSQYDPRAEHQRHLDPAKLSTLQDTLRNSLPNSMFHLFHDDIEDNTPETHEPPQPFSDTYDIASEQFQQMIHHKMTSMTISDQQRNDIEQKTRGQSTSSTWMETRKEKLTASNFGPAITCRVEPSKKLHPMLYSNFTTAATAFGNKNEEVAVEKYVKTKRASDPQTTCKEVGLLVSKDRPWLGASLDRLVTDSTGEGGLEVKCPASKQNQPVDAIVSDSSFCLGKVDGKVSLKKGHRYFHQVQGQLYCANLAWVDFVVYLGNDQDLFIEWIYVDSAWQTRNLPRLDYFYKMAILPELVTRRVRRGITLYEKGGWKPYKE
ncbi:hypothetical protein Bbelb_239450 [Branchiostoma belcheri]|nr:hypothetical protein Bbelb_239450 [Branchiostoma belcheri]